MRGAAIAEGGVSRGRRLAHRAFSAGNGLSQQAMGFLSRQWAFSAPRAFWAPFCLLGALRPPRCVFFDYSTEIAPRTECCTQKGQEMPCTGSSRRAGEPAGRRAGRAAGRHRSTPVWPETLVSSGGFPRAGAPVEDSRSSDRSGERFPPGEARPMTGRRFDLEQTVPFGRALRAHGRPHLYLARPPANGQVSQPTVLGVPGTS